MDEQEFRSAADTSLESLYRKLSTASDNYDFEPDFNSGALTIEFDDGKRFVVSPNTPVRQIWVSAHSRSFKLVWDPGRKSFVLPDTNQNLEEMIAAAIQQQIGEPVTL